MSLCRIAQFAVLACLTAAGFAPAQAPECVDIKGALLARKDGGWQALANGSKIPFDRTLISLFWSDIRSGNGAVDARLRGDIGEFGPLPAFESAIRINDNSKVDLDVTLERGIVVFKNAKKDGAAHVDVRIRDKTLNVTLKDPGTVLGIDLYSRHAPGLAALKADEPTYFVFMLNAVGAAEVSYNGKTDALHAPPGPAIVRWDSNFHEAGVEQIEKLPEWVKPGAEELKVIEQINRAAKTLAGDDPQAAFRKLLNSDDAVERKVGFTALAALGSPKALCAAAQQSKHADSRQFAISVVRNWLGQDVGQLKKLQTTLGELGVSKVSSETLLHLLLGFDAGDRETPATYQFLIEGLHHQKPLVRELSYWHLVRLAPEGKSIAYDPAGAPEQIEAAVRQWRELIPPGQLPHAPKKS